jgi:hypothetical protein
MGAKSIYLFLRRPFFRLGPASCSGFEAELANEKQRLVLQPLGS